MYTFFVVLHVLVSIFLILVVLLQTGKGADMGAAFGGSSSTMFGARGQTTFLHKLTAGMAVVFMILSVALASLSTTGAEDWEEPPPPDQEEGLIPEADTGSSMGGSLALPAEEEEPAKGEDTRDEGAEAPSPQPESDPTPAP